MMIDEYSYLFYKGFVKSRMHFWITITRMVQFFILDILKPYHPMIYHSFTIILSKVKLNWYSSSVPLNIILPNFKSYIYVLKLILPDLIWNWIQEFQFDPLCKILSWRNKF